MAAGCASIPRTKLPAPKKAVRIENLRRIAGREWFWGVYIMGKRVGYSYLKIECPPSMKDVLRITSSLKLDMSSLGRTLKLDMSQLDYTRLDLTLMRSEYSQTYKKDTKSRIALVTPRKLEVQTTIGETSTWKKKKLAQSVYPSSVINLLPVFRGLWVGNSYRYSIYNPETDSIRTVKQRVKSYERLDEFGRPAYRLTTRLRGHKTQSWIDAEGNTLIEKGKLGFLKMSLILESH